MMTLNARCAFAPLLLVALAAAGCGPAAKSSGPAQQAPEVGVVTVTPQRVSLETELPGRTAAYRIAEVRPQVGGILLKRLFTEGAEVKEGQALYQIDPATYRAAELGARAQLAAAEAQAMTARLLAERSQSLIASNVISRQDYDNAMSGHRGADAQRHGCL